MGLMHDVWVVVMSGACVVLLGQNMFTLFSGDLYVDVLINSSSINQNDGGYNEYDDNSFNIIQVPRVCI